MCLCKKALIKRQYLSWSDEGSGFSHLGRYRKRVAVQTFLVFRHSNWIELEERVWLVLGKDMVKGIAGKARDTSS